MSRLTSTEVIDSGKYLADDFDPNTLTIPHLNAIFSYHDIHRPPQANKGKLVQAFRDEIYPRRHEFTQERKTMEDSEASAIGIHDGHTGAHLGSPEIRQPVRRSSRRSSRAPSVEQEVAPVAPKPKRRRSASNPPETLPHRPNKLDSRPSQTTLYEESEPEEDEEPARKINRKKGSVINTQGRRVSDKIGTGTEDSPWEDINIFQSGNESSSPVRPAKPRSSKAKTSSKRSSMSAPPESPGSSPVRRSAPSILDFSPKIPSFTARLQEARPAPSPLRGNEMGNDSFMVQQGLLEDEGDVESGDEEVNEGPSEIKELERYNDAVASEFAKEPSKDVAVRHTQATPRRAKIWNVLLLGILSALLYPYMRESREIGYCEAGTTSNSILREKAAIHEDKERCTKLYAERAAYNLSTDANALSCQPLSPIPWPTPNQCTPCPGHATCTVDTVVCNDKFALRYHPLDGLLGKVLDGIPYLGPKAFPPSCVVDEAGLRKIEVFGKRLADYLGRLRGRKICEEIIRAPASTVGQAKAYGGEINEVREGLRQMYVDGYRRKTGPQSNPPDLDNFDKNFDNAISRLRELDMIIFGEDDAGMVFLAAPESEFTAACRMKVISRTAWEDWKRTLFGWIGAIILALLGRRRLTQNRLESARISGLVQTALEQLRLQETAHYTDPVSYRQPYVSPLHLRDLILRDEHSVAARKRLWDRVERIVENNANVRVNNEEMQGDEVRVWRWIGGSDTAPGTPMKREG